MFFASRENSLIFREKKEKYLHKTRKNGILTTVTSGNGREKSG